MISGVPHDLPLLCVGLRERPLSIDLGRLRRCGTAENPCADNIVGFKLSGSEVELSLLCKDIGPDGIAREARDMRMGSCSSQLLSNRTDSPMLSEAEESLPLFVRAGLVFSLGLKKSLEERGSLAG